MDLKRFSLEGMKEILNTVSKIDKGNRQILLKKFDRDEVNTVARVYPTISTGL